MKTIRYKARCDKLFFIIAIPTALIMAFLTSVSAADPLALIITLAVDALVGYLLISPLFGYVELREQTAFIKIGLILKREIPYSKIRGTSKERKWYSDSMLSLKNSMEHVNIKYNSFDMISVSVDDEDGLMREIEARMIASRTRS